MQSNKPNSNNTNKFIQNLDLFNEISNLTTESTNTKSNNIDIMSSLDILKIINEEDKKVAIAIESELNNISKAVDIIVDRFKKGGRLIYVGAGTSGRLGIVDASECPPTFGVDNNLVVGLIAGGKDAMFEAKEGVEDSFEQGGSAIKEKNLTQNDVVCGLAASGRTPFVLGAMKKALEIGSYVIFITTSEQNENSKANNLYNLLINPIVGPEVIRGSTRMKSGTAQKMVLNMLTTATFVQLGKTYNNIMVDLQLKNSKLEERAKKILMDICDINYDTANELLNSSNGKVKTAIIMNKCKLTCQAANELLINNENKIKLAIIKFEK